VHPAKLAAGMTEKRQRVLLADSQADDADPETPAGHRHQPTDAAFVVTLVIRLKPGLVAARSP
jgi:hypothetical protein